MQTAACFGFFRNRRFFLWLLRLTVQDFWFSSRRCRVQSLRSASVGAKRPSTGWAAPLREYIPLYQNGIWIRLRTGGLRVQIPPRVFFGMWRNGRRAVLRPQSAMLRVRLPPYRFHEGLPQRKTGPVQTRFSEGSNPLSFIYNQQERGK